MIFLKLGSVICRTETNDSTASDCSKSNAMTLASAEGLHHDGMYKFLTTPSPLNSFINLILRDSTRMFSFLNPPASTSSSSELPGHAANRPWQGYGVAPQSTLTWQTPRPKCTSHSGVSTGHRAVGARSHPPWAIGGEQRGSVTQTEDETRLKN